MQDLKRRPWSEDENRLLIASWDTVGSIILISMMLDRSPSSVQTQASRIGLPRRKEDKDKHRRRWSPEDEASLDAAVEALRTPEGKIPIIQVAEQVGRSVDAVVAKLSDRFGEGESLMQVIEVPEIDTSDVRYPSEPVGDGSRSREKSKAALQKSTVEYRAGKEGMTRRCLSCQKPFWSEGAHNRICNKCKSRDGDSDWDW
jgi:hypothetical protein